VCSFFPFDCAATGVAIDCEALVALRDDADQDCRLKPQTAGKRRKAARVDLIFTAFHPPAVLDAGVDVLGFTITSTS
jgi:hypothetical protein